MANYYYGVARGKGARPQDVVVGTSTGSTVVELHVDTTDAPTKKDVIIAIEAIKNFILSNGVGTTTGPGVDLPKL